MSTQTCLTAVKNLGIPNCLTVADATKRAIFVNYYKSDGSINGIDLSTLSNGILDAAAWGVLVNNLDDAERFYLTPKLNLVTDVREDEVTEDVGGGQTVPVRDGVRNFEGHVIKADPTWLKHMDTWKGKTVGVFFIDKSGNLIGNGRNEGYLYPIRLEENTLRALLIKGTDDAVQKVKINFQISELEKDSEIGMIDNSMITADLMNTRPLVDVYANDVQNISTTGFDVELVSYFGGVTSKLPAEGLALADFYIYNETDASAVTATTVTENSGQTLNYSFVIPAQTSLDVLRVENKQSGTLDKGLDIETFWVTIP